MKIWHKLLDLRESHNLTQERLAKKLGISVNSIKNYEHFNKDRIPNPKELKKYAEYFKVSYDYLLDDTIENQTAENIQIEKILNLSDKAISNLKDYNHLAFNLLLESNMFGEISNLFDLYIKLLDLKQITKELLPDDQNVNIALADKISKIMETYDNYKEENPSLLSYTNSMQQTDELYSHIISDDEEERDTFINVDDDTIDFDLWEEYENIRITIEGALKVLKFELTETFSKFLNEITN